jgi:hypothetical protein
MKKQQILGVGKESLLGPKVIPYLVSFDLGNHKVFLGSLIFSHPSRRNDILSEDEDELIAYMWYPNLEMD